MPNYDPRQTVRVGPLERALAAFKIELDSEIGEKMAHVLEKYHRDFVMPYEARMAELEWKLTPWYRRLWSWARPRIDYGLAYVGARLGSFGVPVETEAAELPVLNIPPNQTEPN